MTNPAFFLPAIANNVTTPQFVGAVGAGDVTIALKTGHGALLPSISRGAATSTTSSTSLTDTGDLGGLAVGDFLYNLTDGSWCVVTSISGAPNTVTTTALQGGSDNTWQSADVWVKGAIVLTGVQYDVDGVTVLKRERMLATNLVTDTLTVVRGYDGDTPQTFNANDYCQILIEKSMMENLQKGIRHLVQRIEAEETLGTTRYGNITNDNVTWLGTITGTNTLTGSATPAPTAYAAGQRYAFKVANTCSGAVTLNVNGLGAKNLYAPSGVALVSGDIIAGGIVECRYDGTQFVMTSEKHAAAISAVTPMATITAASSNVGASSTSELTVSPTWTGSVNCGSSKLALAGSRFRLFLSGAVNNAAGYALVRIKMGSTTLGTFELSGSPTNDAWAAYLDIVCRTPGASGVVIAGGQLTNSDIGNWPFSSDGSKTPPAATGAFDLTATQNLVITVQYSVSNASNAFAVHSGYIELINAPA